MTLRLPWASVTLALLACTPTPKPASEEAAAGPAATPDTATPALPAGGDPKLADAMNAAPASISQNAAIKDWPAKPGGDLGTLREGTNGWVCLPDEPSTKGSDPMCLDQTWQAWLPAYMAKKNPPPATRMGIGYMLTSDVEGSNTDPFATGPTPDNQWGKAGPHVMVIVPDPAQLASLSTDPENGGPWVMWKGTPYVHVMVPVQ